MIGVYASRGLAIPASRRGRPVLLFLDYDGTLVEIAARPPGSLQCC